MKKEKPKILVVLGPTATGKSDLAVELAHDFNGEVISADSRQVYRGMNLGTGKISKKEMKGVPHHLLDVVNPKQVYTVAKFQKNAREAIEDILSRGRLPILCGGTGFYIQSIVDGIILPNVAPDKTLRTSLSKKTAPALFKILTKLDPKRAATIDLHNPVRLIRAIEIAKTLGKTPPIKKDIRYDALQIGLDLPDEILKKKIYDRILIRMKKGMIAEAKKLHHEGLSYRRMRMLGLEYGFLADLIEEKITRAQFIEQLSVAIFQYVKRQRAWFKRDERIIWHTPKEMKEIEREVKAFCLRD